MQAFRDAIDDCNLMDMGYIGDKFTWQRGNIRERLDRALANEAWSDKFPDACLHHLDYYRSDHRPILMCFEEPVVEENRGPPVLRFEARWLKEKNFMEIVQGAWNLSDPLDMDLPLAGKLAKVHDQLHRWDMSVLKRNKNTLRKTQRELENVVRQSMSPENLARQKELADEIEKLLEMEEIHWAQRSRVDWLKYGDHNTNYFHNAASTRRKKNRIMKLIDDNGNHIEGTIYLNPLISDYFAGLFTTEVDEPDPDLLSKVILKVTEQMNNGLIADYTPEDVKKALFSIGDTKALGTDGLHALFFKKCWGIIGDSIVKEVLEAINNKVIPEGWNDTVIVLIPKVDSPEKISQFRPISLCNVLYKVISKMIALRLKVILDEVISNVQSAFVPGRLITDNILIAYESMHCIKNKKTGKKGYCAVKLDMHKAYDRVEWIFLERMMIRLGFHHG
jgi:hypothetical protein